MSRRLRLDAPPPAVLLEGDARVHALREVRVEPTRPNEYVAEITRLWRQAEGTFLEIGQLLIRAKDTLPHGDYIKAVEAELPFSSRTAYQLREAARWAQGGPFPLERLPRSYSTLYLLSTLSPPLLQVAERDGVIRPELRRAELIQWRKQQAGEEDGQTDLEGQLERLRRERARLDDEIRALEAQLRIVPST